MIRTCRRGDRLVPPFLGPADHPWLLILIDELAAFAGRPERDLDAHLRQPFQADVPRRKLGPATHVLRRLHGHGQDQGSVPPVAARAAVFTAAAGDARTREEILAEVAARLGLPLPALEAALHADLPGERPLGSLLAPLGADTLAARVNLALAESLLARARAVQLEAPTQHAPVLIAHARRRGLLCVIDERQGRTRMALSGPLALFHHTVVYGRALGSLAGVLAGVPDFHLQASCVVDGDPLPFELDASVVLQAEAPPLSVSGPGRGPARFARAFERKAPGWRVELDPAPLAADDGRLLLADLALHAPDGHAWRLERVGYWTPAYLAAKLADHDRAGQPRILLCIGDQLAAGGEGPPEDARIIKTRRLEPELVLAAIARWP